MPVNLSELRTLIADSVRVQRLQELQQGAGRSNQDAMASQFRDVLDVRRAFVKESADTQRARIEQNQGRRGRRWSRRRRGLEAEPGAPGAEQPEGAESSEGVGRIIDLRG